MGRWGTTGRLARGRPKPGLIRSIEHWRHLEPGGPMRPHDGNARHWSGASIELFGETEFPEVRGDLDRLGVSDATKALVEDWLSSVRDATDDDQAVLAGVRAAAAIARELSYTSRVRLSMRYPFTGDWFL